MSSYLCVVPPHFFKNTSKDPECDTISQEEITIGDKDNNPTCCPCFNVSATGKPKPIGIWYYYNTSSNEYVCVMTNKSDPNSHFYQQETDEVCC